MFIKQTNRYVNRATAISIIVLLIGITTLASGISRTAESWRWVIHTREVLQHVNGTFSLINQADALQKSLRLAPDERDAADLRAMLAAIPHEVQVLTRLTSDNPLQQRVLADLSRLLDTYTEHLKAGLERTLPDPGRDGERAVRQAIAGHVAALRAEEERLLLLREALVREDRTKTIAAAATVSVLSIGLLLLVRFMARREEAALLVERANLDTTLRSIGEAVIAVDVQGRVRFMNRVAEQILGCDEEHAKGQQLESVFRLAPAAPEDARLPSVLRSVLSGKLPESGVAISGSFPPHQDGRRDWILNCYPMLGGEKLYGAVVSMLDVTQLRLAQRELSDANQLLEQRVQERTAQLAEANLELRAFAHTIAHDLRAPLRNVQGYATALLEDEERALSKVGKSFLQRMQAVIRRMDRLVTDLLAYSQLSRSELRLQEVDLDRVFQLALEDMDAQVASTHALVEVASPLPQVLGSEAILVQVVENLIGNAIKFVAPGVRPEIRVEGRTDGERAQIWISDNGIGIPAEKRERVFEVFERLHGEEQYPGTGIGLAIVKKGIERLGGSVNVEPSRAGTTFRLCLQLPGASGVPAPGKV